MLKRLALRARIEEGGNKELEHKQVDKAALTMKTDSRRAPGSIFAQLREHNSNALKALCALPNLSKPLMPKRPMHDQLRSSHFKKQRCAVKLDKSQKSRKGKGSFQESSKEYQKHNRYRILHDFITGDGAWQLDESLQQFQLPALSPRILDVLHIIYLSFRARGVAADSVDQIWDVSQSVLRYTKRGLADSDDMVRSKHPCIPGFCFDVSKQAVVPCILPSHIYFHNKSKRFLSGHDFLELQAINYAVPAFLSQFKQRTLKQAAGNSFTMSVVQSFVRNM
jgi:hypothetical protein